MTSPTCRSWEKGKNVITWADLSPWEPSFTLRTRRRTSGAQARGLRYERKAQGYITEICQGRYAAAPWFRYKRNYHPHWRYCQPDGIIFDFNRNLITVVEIKISHASRAWTQMRTLYEPVVRYVFGKRWKYAVCEVTAWFDPSIEFPEPIRFISDFSTLQPGQLGVYILRERKLNEYARRTRK